MAVLTVEQLKARFEKGDYPVEADYSNLIDTLLELAGGSASITASETAPVNPDPSALWYNTLEARPYVFYDNFWVELVPTVQGPPGPIGQTGVVGASSPLVYDANSRTISISSQALFDSPYLSGTPTAPTANAGTNTTQIATTEFVRNEVTSIIDSAPSTLDTLNELAAALGDDPNFATTIVGELATKAPSTSPTISNPTINPSVSGNSYTVTPTEISYLDGSTSNIQTQLDSKAPLNSDVVSLGMDRVRTLIASDNGKTIIVYPFEQANVNITVPNILPVGGRVDFINRGSTNVTFVASGITLNSKDSKFKMNGQYSAASIICYSSGVYVLVGDLKV